MKRRIVFGLTGLLCMLSIASCDNSSDEKDKVISVSELPAKADAFVKKYFPDASYKLIKKENKEEVDGSVYDVILTNNFEIDFDIEGNWIDIEGNDQTIPMGIIPKKIENYVLENYENWNVIAVDSEKTGIEIILSNKLELVFDLEGNFIGIDD